MMREYTRRDPGQKFECYEEHFNAELCNIVTRTAAARVSPCVVQIVSRNLPEGMFFETSDKRERVFIGSGFIIECEKAGDGTYCNFALTHAALFQRTNGVQPNQIQVDVYLSGGKLCKGEVFACDFHYGLAAIMFQSETSLQVAKLRDLDDIISIDPAKQSCSRAENSFELRQHSNLFKILPGDKLIAIGRYLGRPVTHRVDFSLDYSSLLDCRELRGAYGIDVQNEVFNGGPLCNQSGEVVGILLCDSSFLPMNIVSRWWMHYKSFRQYHRPLIGFEVFDLHAAPLKFLEIFVQKFPNINVGVLVTEVEQDSPAYFSGIRAFDVIVQCDGKSVRSTLELFENIWDARKSVTLSVARASHGGLLNLTTTIGEATPDKFYWWKTPNPKSWDLDLHRNSIGRK